MRGLRPGDSWNGKPITLQIDHINGRFLDCRAENLRFLCPNCHSQTPTHAGRNIKRRSTPFVRVDSKGNAAEDTKPVGTLTQQQKIDVLKRVDGKEMAVSDIARLLGCSRSYVYILRRKLMRPDGRESESPEGSGKVNG
ncbi:helix-turn-helix domain-containing protein [Actinoplanes sp. N902-109]|uniref:helix-turn-helix domain-containing protein n=1 Tax=Actinoplanes sp. (strain N902-109) TaxID=649831 RepID=UPI0003295C87|nr:hypothetical protein L083_1295 [Actinoplanes sp. N902-109]